MAPVVPFIPLVVGLAGAVATVTGSIISSRQADAAAKRQEEYNNKLQAEQQAAQAKEQQLAAEAAERSRAYGASLLESDTAKDNLLSGSWDDEDYLGSGSVLTNSLQPGGVQSMFA